MSITMKHDGTVIPEILFREPDVQKAHELWGCNCGPSALAAILGRTLDGIREPCEQAGFGNGCYMSPSRMRRAIEIAGGKITKENLGRDWTAKQGLRCLAEHGLVRVQWTGPWTRPGANPKWAYRQTHWIATWWMHHWWLVFDVNSGLSNKRDWEENVVPVLTQSVPRADGGWFITHSWEVA